MTMRFGAGLLALSLVLAGCDTTGIEIGPPHSEPEPESVLGPGGISIGSLGRGNGPSASETLGINSYLWRGALETLSFLPLASSDPLGGAIVTDWGTPDGASGERIKAAAYVKGAELQAANLSVAVFRQTRDAGGAWVDAPVSPETVRRLEDAILFRARELRVASVDGL